MEHQLLSNLTASEHAQETDPTNEAESNSELEIALQIIQENIVDLKITVYVMMELMLVYGCSMTPDVAHEVVSELFPDSD